MAVSYAVSTTVAQPLLVDGLTNLIQAILTGLMQGGVYALISIGLTIIFGVMGIINFAQGEFLMLGMYTTFFLFVGLAISPLLLFFLIVPVYFVFGAIVQRTLISNIIGEQEESQLILTFGILLILQNLALIAFGGRGRTFDISYSVTSFTFGPFALNQARTIAFLFSIGLAVSVLLFLRYTRFGRAMRATANNSEAAEYAGINVKRVYMAAFGLGTAVTASAGALLVMYWPVSPTVGFQFVIIMFVVVVLGGLGSVKGALLAGLFIGVVERVGVIWLPLELQPALPFVLFLGVIFFMPQGLFGTVVRDV